MDVQRLAEAWRRRFQEEEARLFEQAARARERAGVAARALADEFGASGVWLFGSLAWGPLHAGSDVDLAVRGVPADRHFAALARACEIVGGPVDLVPLETCAESLRRRVLAHGVRLDAR